MLFDIFYELTIVSTIHVIVVSVKVDIISPGSVKAGPEENSLVCSLDHEAVLEKRGVGEDDVMV